MKLSFPTPSGLVERSYKESGPIERPGFSDYGLIMTNSPGHSASDFNPNDLVGVIIENTALPGDNERFFTILGGYYLTTTQSGGTHQPQTLNVFGIALSNADGFEIQEGGSVVLSDHWQLKNPPGGMHPVAGMRERNFIGGNVTIESETGWTFIVEEARSFPKFPKSRVALSLYTLCPEIKEIRKDEIGKSASEQTFQFTVDVNGPTPDTFKWDFGDGSPLETTNSPTATHSFTSPAGNDVTRTISVTIQGPGNTCQSTSQTHITLTGVCPALQTINIDAEQTNASTQFFRFSVAVNGPAPDTFEWDWGDSSDVEITTSPNASHTFNRPAGDNKTLSVSVKLKGPDNCESTGQVSITLTGVCPVVKQITSKVGALGDTSQEVHFTAEIEGPAPTSFEWNFGDGSAPKTTSSPDVSHTYTRPEGDLETYKVTLSTSGPDSCKTSAETDVSIAGTCPVIGELTSEVVSLDETNLTLTFTVTTQGPTPNQYKWNFGDGSATKNTTNSTETHSYTRPGGDPSEPTVKVTLLGPDSCESSRELLIQVPRVCPVITEFQVRMEPLTDQTQPVRASVTTSGPIPETYTFDWGDGSDLETTPQNAASHAYTRNPGDDTPYTVKVTLDGPGTCQSDAEQSITVAGICPKIKELKQEGVLSGEGSLEVRFELEIEGPAPDQVEWSWGDGTSHETTTGLVAVHTYAQPPGDADTYPVSATISGPGGCSDSTQVQVEVPGICPIISMVDPVLGKQEVDTQEVNVSLTIVGPRVSRFEWDWGDGSAIETTKGPEATHVYPRGSGAPETYTIRVKSFGPDSCESSAEATIIIEESCPVIGNLVTKLVNTQPQHEVIDFQVEVSNGSADSYEWDFGDGSPVETTSGPQVSHKFDRKSKDEGYTVSVNAVGPGDCRGNASLQITVPALTVECPTLTGIRFNKENETVDTISYSFHVDVDKGKPDSFEWEWGDGSPKETTTSPNATHVFSKNPDKSLTCSITVNSKGPGDCKGSTFTSVNIPQAEEPKVPLLCTLLSLLAGLFLALTAGTAIVQIVGDNYPEAGADNASWPVILMIIFAAVFAITVGLYYYLGKKDNCPPGKCDWYAWIMLALLTETAISFFLLGCTTGFWWILPVITFVGAGIFGYLWFRFCALQSKVQRFFAYMAMFLIATFIVIFMIARPYLACV